MLLVPLIATQFTGQVNWEYTDFIVAGILLFGTGLILESVAQKLHNSAYRAVAVIAIVVIFLLIWAELAVGIFGTPWAGS